MRVLARSRAPFVVLSHGPARASLDGGNMFSPTMRPPAGPARTPTSGCPSAQLPTTAVPPAGPIAALWKLLVPPLNDDTPLKIEWPGALITNESEAAWVWAPSVNGS